MSLVFAHFFLRHVESGLHKTFLLQFPSLTDINRALPSYERHGQCVAWVVFGNKQFVANVATERYIS